MRMKRDNKFTGEFRVMVNRTLYPNLTSDELWEMLTQIINDGKTFDGIVVKYFDMRGKPISREHYKEYGFFSNATRFTALPVQGYKKGEV